MELDDIGFYSLILSNVDTTCQSPVLICECIWGFCVSESNMLIAFAALTEILPPPSSLRVLRTSFTVFLIFI